MFSRAPERIVVDAKPKQTPGGTYHRQLMLPARKTRAKGAPMANPAPSISPPSQRHESGVLAQQGDPRGKRSCDLAQALYHIDTGIKREAEPVNLCDARPRVR